MALLERWVKENNDLVETWRQQAPHILIRDRSQSRLKACSLEFDKLLRKIQGVPAGADHAQLELAVVYNTCVFSLAQSQFSGAEVLLTQGLERALEVMGNGAVASDQPMFWRAALKAASSLGNTALCSSMLRLLCIQWALWLSTCRLKTIQDFQEELSSLSETLGTAVEEERRSAVKGNTPEILRLVVDPKKLKDLLEICTVITQGGERLSGGQNSEALSELQRGLSLSAPRNLLANIHLLSGLCLANMGRPQMALQCHKQALETDASCVRALHQSVLIYRQLGNIQAEIDGLRLLNSALMLPPATDASLVEVFPLSAPLLLRSQSLSSLLSVPSSISVLHSLAMKCVLHGRVSEGLEHYLDLLAVLHSDSQHIAHADASDFPRLPVLYLEAGAASLMAGRPADCMALCDEVISTTSDLLPERLILEEPGEDDGRLGEPESGSLEALGSDQDRLGMMLWTGSAHLLQAHCQAHLKDWKQAVTHYTRCINLMGKVHVVKKGFHPHNTCVDVAGELGLKLTYLQRLKGLSLAGRGISFTQRDQLREALRDLQLSRQASPEYVSAGLWLGEVLWRLRRRREAASCWENTWSTTMESSLLSLPLYLHDPKSWPSLDSTELHDRIQDLVHT